jgi:1,4-alpha-glucan branching enzyme
MAIRIRNSSSSKTTIQFVLPDDVHAGPVSAVGTFNGWTPDAHRLVKRSNGTRSVTVDVPPGEEIRFRYLGDGGRWFDDPEALEMCPEGVLVRV